MLQFADINTFKDPALHLPTRQWGPGPGLAMGQKIQLSSHFAGAAIAQQPPALSCLRQLSLYCIFHMHSTLAFGKMEQVLLQMPWKKFHELGKLMGRYFS